MATDDPVERLWPGWASSRSSTGSSRAASSRPRSRSVPVTTRRWCSPATAERWCPPTCWWPDGISGWTGRARMTSAARPLRRTPPISRPWARWPTAFVVAFGAPGDTPTSQALELADGMWDEARRLGAGIVGGDLVSAPQWVISVTALGDLGGRQPVRRGGARPGRHAGRRRRTGSLGGGICVVAQRHSRVRGVTPSAPGARTALRSGPGRRRCRCHRDDRRLRRPDGRSRPRRTGIRCRYRRVHRRADDRPRGRWRGAAAATGADAWAWVLGGGEDHALVATFPGPPPDGLAGDRPGARRPATRAGGRRAMAGKSGLAVVLTNAAR